MGLSNARGNSCAFPDYITTPDVVRRGLRQDLHINLGVAEYLSYISPLRAPPKTLQLTATGPDEKLLKSAPQGQNVPICPSAYRKKTGVGH